MKIVSRDEYELSSGRRFYANCLIIGLNPGLETCEGYDGDIHTGDSWQGPDLPWGGGWTTDEKRELAEFMIALWTKYRDAA